MVEQTFKSTKLAVWAEGYPATSVTIYQSTLYNIAEGRNHVTLQRSFRSLEETLLPNVAVTRCSERILLAFKFIRFYVI
jgi:hypothetical protein